MTKNKSSHTSQAKLVLEETAFNVDYIGNGFPDDDADDTNDSANASKKDKEPKGKKTDGGGGDDVDANDDHVGGGGSRSRGSSNKKSGGSPPPSPSIMGRPPISPGIIGRFDSSDSYDFEDDGYGEDMVSQMAGYVMLAACIYLLSHTLHLTHE